MNQYGPPDAAPTARLLGDVAEFLRARGHAVVIVSQRAEDYRAQGTRPAGGRLRRELGALARLLWLGWRARVGVGEDEQRPEIILALSSPPCLLVLAALLARRHGAVLAHWAMDLYPELAGELGEIPRRGWAYRALEGFMRRAYRQCAVVVALDEDMRDHLENTYGLSGVRVLAPWPPPGPAATVAGGQEEEKVVVQEVLPPEPGGGRAAWTWLYSGNLGRAHEWETLLAAQRLLEDRGVPVDLVFQGSGTVRGAARARAEALGLRRCHWRGYAEANALAASLRAAGALVVTQRPAARGLLWPSKLATVERLGRPVLWVGPTDGAIARRLRAGVPGAGIFAPGEAGAVAEWVEARFRGRKAAEDEVAGAGVPPVVSGPEPWEGWLTGALFGGTPEPWASNASGQAAARGCGGRRREAAARAGN